MELALPVPDEPMRGEVNHTHTRTTTLFGNVSVESNIKPSARFD
jgi:hypothetical protein